MKRARLILTLLVLMPFVIGGGGAAPGIPADKILKAPRFNAVIVMDPHNAGVTTTAKRATIRIGQGSKFAAAVFDVIADFPLAFGCDPDLTETRFLNRELTEWIPSAIKGGSPVVEELFAAMGVVVTSENSPIITKIDVPRCTPDANNPGPLANDVPPGILSFHAPIVFLVPR